MFDLTYSCEPVFFGRVNRSPSLCPQPISQDSYGICTWRKPVRDGCTEIRRHRASLALADYLEVARPEQAGAARGEEEGPTAAGSAAHLITTLSFRSLRQNRRWHLESCSCRWILPLFLPQHRSSGQCFACSRLEVRPTLLGRVGAQRSAGQDRFPDIDVSLPVRRG
jgi:hypothetical protein